MTPASAHHPHPAQQAVQRILDRAILDGAETGIQAAAYLNGQPIVDAWAAVPFRHLDGASLIPFFSTGKGICSTAIHLLVQRGVLAYDAPVARYWPEFAANGKSNITLRMILDHTSGMSRLPETGTYADFADWDGLCRALAAMEPAHEPGTKRYYHGVTHGHLLGEIARRADGRDIASIIREEISVPLKLDGIWFGTPDSQLHRVFPAEIAPPTPPAAGAAAPAPAATPAPMPTGPPDPIPQRSIPNWIKPLEDWVNCPEVRRACIPASNGYGNARSIAKHYAALVGPGVDGIRLLSDATVAEALRQNLMPGETRAGHCLGYGPCGPDSNPEAAFGHGGYGGSIGWADRRYGLAVAVVKTRMGGGAVTQQVVEEIRKLTGSPHAA